MRSNEAECEAIGRWLVNKFNAMKGPSRLLIPLRGLSSLDAPQQPFEATKANQALFMAIEQGYVQHPEHQLERLDLHLNDPEFAAAVVRNVRELIAK